MSSFNERSLSKKTVVIIGSGPAGLASAYFHLKLGHKVVIIDKRVDPATRDRKIFLPWDFMNPVWKFMTNFSQNGYKLVTGNIYRGDTSLQIKLLGKPGNEDGLKPVSATDLKFFKDLCKRHRLTSIMSVQNYFAAKISELVKADETLSVQYITGEVINIDAKAGTVTYHAVDSNGNVVKEVDANGNNIYKQVSVDFDDVEIAAGNKVGRALAQALFTANGGNYEVKKLPTSHIPGKEFAAISSAIVAVGVSSTSKTLQNWFNCLDPNKVVAPDSMLSKLSLQDLPKLEAAGWKKDRLPNYFIHIIETPEGGRKFFISGEIPEQFQAQWDNLKTAGRSPCDDQDLRENMLKWATTLLEIEYPEMVVSDVAKYLKLQSTNEGEGANATKGGHEFEMFRVNPDYIKTPCIQVTGPDGSTRHCCVIGDAEVGSNFYLGHGFLKLIQEAIARFHCYDPDTGEFKTDKPFLDAHEQLVRDYNYHLSLFFAAADTRVNRSRGKVIHWLLAAHEDVKNRINSIGAGNPGATLYSTVSRVGGMFFRPRRNSNSSVSSVEESQLGPGSENKSSTSSESTKPSL